VVFGEQHIARVEPRADRPRRLEASRRQRRANKRHQSQRHFGDYQQTAHPILAGAGRYAPAAFL
jgi:hypothetical protein